MKLKHFSKNQWVELGRTDINELFYNINELF